MADTQGKPDSSPPSPSALGRVPRRPIGASARPQPDWSSALPHQPIPDRYEARENEDGPYVVCDEAPRMRVSIHVANSFSESEARELGERVILLDGAGRFGPLLDNKAYYLAPQVIVNPIKNNVDKFDNLKKGTKQ